MQDEQTFQHDDQSVTPAGIWGCDGSFKNILALSDMGNAELLTQLLKGKMCYEESQEQWRVYTEGFWQKSKGNALMEQAKNIVQLVKIEADALPDRLLIDKGNGKEEFIDNPLKSRALDFVKYSASAHGLRNMIAVAKSTPALNVKLSHFDANPYLLNVQNGTVNLRTGTLQDHNPADYLTVISPTTYDPSATCPLWLEFLRYILNDEPAMEEYFQRMMGYGITADTSEECFFFLKGLGANGKTTFLNTVKRVVGDGYAQSPDFEIFTDSKPSSLQMLAQLTTCVVVFTGEPEDQGPRLTLHTARLKKICGSDELTANPKYKDAFQFKPKFKLYMMSNYDLNVGDAMDYGFWRKLRFIKMVRQFKPGTEIKGYGERFLPEYSGILNWLVEGAKKWYADHVLHQQGHPEIDALKTPQSVWDATKEQQGLSNPLAEFIDDCLVIHDPRTRNRDTATKRSDVYKAYVQWAKASDIQHPIGNRHFYTLMERLGYECQNGGDRAYYGITLKGDVQRLLNTKKAAQYAYAQSQVWSETREALKAQTAAIRDEHLSPYDSESPPRG